MDSDDAVADSIAALLESVGVESRLFPSVDTFLAGFDASDAGCVTVDIGDDLGTAFRLIRLLRHLGHAVPVIVFNSQVDAESRRRAAEGGASALLPKPPDPGEFVRHIRQLLSI
ncbi:MAG TPA: response regulator [Rhizomicrobium sp.]|nr:response regulator [Rhizomicrobium sp.]